MSVDQKAEPIETLLANAPDPGFKGRANYEYNTIKGWVGKRIDLERAKVLDFGCGQGIAATSFALRHPQAKVQGLDIEPVKQGELKAIYRKQIGRDLPPNVAFVEAAPGQLPVGKDLDLIFAWSVFEHVREDLMTELFRSLKSRLAKNGLLFVQVNPLYFSPRGSHLYNYFKSPWHHLILSLESLREGVLSDQPNEREQREWTQFLDLNRLTARDIIGRATDAGLKLVREQHFKTDLAPPPRLTRIYDKDVLTTNEFIALFEV